jgi:hypothetical protein
MLTAQLQLFATKLSTLFEFDTRDSEQAKQTSDIQNLHSINLTAQIRCGSCYASVLLFR